MHVHSPLQLHASLHHHAAVQSTNLGAVLTHDQWTPLDRWSPARWWPDAVRDLPAVGPGGIGPETASATFVLPPRADSVHSSRIFAAGTLAGWGLPELRENTELVVSELATNALRHGLRRAGCRPQPAVRLWLIRHGDLVVCAITDPAPEAPVLRRPTSLEPGGLGLHIVQSLSLRWGWAPLTPQGKIVWAVISS